MLVMPYLETSRLMIRPFTLEDLDEAEQLFDVDLNTSPQPADEMSVRHARREWLEWTVRNMTQLATLNQPPYGDRAIILKSVQSIVGSCGFVPCLNTFEQMPNMDYYRPTANPALNSTEFGLYYAISPTYQRFGYATEAAHALVEYAFGTLHLKRVVATTEYENLASIGVMRRLGMKIGKNPKAEPKRLQVVGMLENASAADQEVSTTDPKST